MSYRGRSRSGYGSQKRRGWHRKGSNFNRAKKAFEERSSRSKALDLVKMAEIAPNITAYIRSPNRYDWRGVDTVDPSLVFEHKSVKAKVADLSKLAKRTKDVEVWFKHTAEYDMQGIDTPPNNKKRARVPEKTTRFKVVTKKEAKQEAEKVLKVAGQEQTKTEKAKGRKLPSREEILQRAKEMFMDYQARLQLPTTTPELEELQELGLIQRAQSELMRSESTIADEHILKYVDELRVELEPMGFAIVPLSEI